MTGTTVGTPLPPVDYAAAARRHGRDAESLHSAGRIANAGQLFGFVAECGVKALLVACGAPIDADGSVARPATARGRGLRDHMPDLLDTVATQGHLIPDGRTASGYLAAMPSLNRLRDWSIDHRYWGDAALPSSSVGGWRQAANEVLEMLDKVKQNGGP